MFLVTGEYRIQRDGDVYPYGIFRQISVYQFVMTFSSREDFPLRNQVPDFRRKKLIPVIAYTYYIECLHGLIHLFPVSVVPHHQSKDGIYQSRCQIASPLRPSTISLGMWLKGFTMCLLSQTCTKPTGAAMMPHGCAFLSVSGHTVPSML